VLCAVAGAALASKPTLRLERIDPSTFASDGKVRVFASLVELEGQIDEGKGAQGFVLRTDGRRPVRAESVSPFRAAAVPLDLVLVIETSALYGVQKLPPPSATPTPPPAKGTRRKLKQKGKGKPSPTAPTLDPVAPAPLPAGELPLDRVKEALATLLESRPVQTRVLVIDYGGEVTTHAPFRPGSSATGAVEDLQPDDESGDLHLVDAVRAALLELNRPRPMVNEEVPPRRLIVVVSDGLNAQMDRKTFRALGDAAATARVPIHTIAFSPADDRGPLLNLGEIAKRSNGTFRWARSVEDLKAQIETLGDELDKQYVLTFTPNVAELEGHTFTLECEGLRSNPLRYEVGGTVFGYTGASSRRSKLWTVLGWVGGVLVGLFLLYLMFGIVLRLVMRPRRARGPRVSLVFLEGARQGERVAISPERPHVLGKSGTLVLDDAAVSTRHAQLAFDGRGWLLTDLESRNGTWVDGRRLDGPTYLSPGQTVQLGQTKLRFLG
jgi:hypothetical protein